MKNINFIDKMSEYKPQKQSLFMKLLFRIILFFVGLGKPTKFIYHFKAKDVRHKQVLLLADHSARNAYHYALRGYKWQTFQCLVGYHNFFESKILFKLMTLQGAIPKMLFAPDIKSVKSTFRLIKKGVSIAVFPEGIQSNVGKNHPTNPATYKFIKACGIDVILCTSRGEYLNRPRCTDFDHKGKCEVEYRILFTKDELKTLSEKEIEERYTKYFYYNDFKWNKEMHYEYKSKKESNASCFENLLYHCPKCKTDFNILAVKNNLKCFKCGNEIEIDKHYDMIPVNNSYLPFERIDLWFDYQKKLINEEIKNDDFEIEYECDLYQIDPFLKKGRYIKVGHGISRIDHKNYIYTGTQNNNDVKLIFAIKQMPSFTFFYGKGNGLYYNSEYYLFYPTTTTNMIVKYMLYIEELHKLLNPIWAKASKLNEKKLL